MSRDMIKIDGERGIPFGIIRCVKMKISVNVNAGGFLLKINGNALEVINVLNVIDSTIENGTVEIHPSDEHARFNLPSHSFSLSIFVISLS